jgi:hypothetical protein
MAADAKPLYGNVQRLGVDDDGKRTVAPPVLESREKKRPDISVSVAAVDDDHTPISDAR